MIYTPTVEEWAWTNPYSTKKGDETKPWPVTSHESVGLSTLLYQPVNN